ncbi:MAG TPA: aldolase/citrate lyase family protein [Hyphomicrobiaceae bacterium]|nr:aldolase/citrate lyase family protein [Hyphomicrobiaceae bacterium]
MAKTIRQRVLKGEQVLGTMMFEFFTPGIAQICKNAGCEYIIYDMEHAGLGYETFKTQVAHCRGIGVAPMVRVPRSDYQFLARALDVGAEGVMIPMVESVAQAKAIAEATRYPPVGRRGAAFGFAHDNYEGGAPADKIKAANAKTLVIAQIETERGLAEVEGIAAIDGIDVLWVGHFDLTNFLGIPGQFDNPKYIDAIKRIVKAGRASGKGLGFMAADAKWARDYKKMGFNMLASGTDMNMVTAGIKAILDPLR